LSAAILDGELPIGSLIAVRHDVPRCRQANSSAVFHKEAAGFSDRELRLLEEVARLLAVQVRNMDLILRGNQLFLGTLFAMSQAIDARDNYTQGHSQRVALLSFELAQLRGLSDKACHEIYLAGIVHDVGKIGIPDRVLLKEGKLTDEEFMVIRQHPEIGHRILDHHERWDGRGYPHGLCGESIPLMARIISVADAFDAMTSSRPYRTAMDAETAHSIIRAGAAHQWDAEIVTCFSCWLAVRQRHLSDRLPKENIIPSGSTAQNINRAVLALTDLPIL
jgi:HD-GYP domain-containing protein (c-di-GMP phosphodiesterase class II)